MDTMLITGANRGLGLEWVRQLDQAGWRIRACCRNPDKADELTLLANNADGRITIHKLDVADHAAIEALAGELKDEAIDVLCNNAGGAGGVGTDFEMSDPWGQTNYEKWRWAMEGNLFGTCKMSEAFTPHVACSNRRIMITMASTLSSISTPGGGSLVWGDEKHVYRTTKAAINMLAKSMSGYLKDQGVIVVSINPGWANTVLGRAGLGPGDREDILLDPVESIRGMRALIDRLTLTDSGNLYQWNGDELPP